MVSEIERLKSDASAQAAEIISIVSEKELLTSELCSLKSDLATSAAINSVKDQEIETLITSHSAKDTIMAQMQQSAGSAGVAFLQAKVDPMGKDYDTLYKDYEREHKEKHEAWDSLRAIQAPQAVGGSYKRVLDLLESAAAVTNTRTEWDRGLCNTLAEEMVKGMLSSTEAGKASVVNEHTAKVFFSSVCGFIH